MNNGVTTAHSDAEAARNSAVNAQEAADAWRKGSTPNAGPVLALSQGPSGKTATYDARFGDLETSLKEQQDAYTARAIWGNKQEEEANAWRGVAYTPTDKDLGLVNGDGSLVQRRALQSLVQGPSGKTATYDERLDGMSTVTGNAQDLYEGKRTWGINEQERENVWRGVHPVTQDSEWEGVQSLVQGQPGPIWTDYDKHAEDLKNTLDAHNAAWWAEHKAQIAKQKAVDAWRDGYTANTGPELPYSLI